MDDLIPKVKSQAQHVHNAGMHAMAVARAHKIKKQLALTNPETGKKYTQREVARMHKISVGRIVQLLRLIRHGDFTNIDTWREPK